MSDVALRKVEDEVERLQQELNICKDAQTTSQACHRIIEETNDRPEAFCTDYPNNNVWQKKGDSAGPCLIL